ncbi:MAG: M15 family metallopeptidase [Anaerovoracaceae bacterium]
MKKYRTKPRFKIIVMCLLILAMMGIKALITPSVGEETAPVTGTTVEESKKPATETTNSKPVEKQSKYLILVNKTHSIGKKDVPEDLQKLKTVASDRTSTYQQMSKPAAIAFEKLAAGAKADGYEIVATTAYRPYNYQKELYDNYVAKDGKTAAETYSAKPGTSEHQTGLSVDVSSPSVSYRLTQEYGKTAEGKWLAQNAHKYGFIIRFLKGRSEITGYEYEPWHIRYVGKQPAKEIYDQDITLEEYLGKN